MSFIFTYKLKYSFETQTQIDRETEREREKERVIYTETLFYNALLLARMSFVLKIREGVRVENERSKVRKSILYKYELYCFDKDFFYFNIYSKKKKKNGRQKNNPNVAYVIKYLKWNSL